MDGILGSIFSIDFLVVVIRVGVPLVFASLAAYVASLVGLSNIAIEGIMIMSALSGVLISAFTGSAWFGFFGAAAIGIFMALVIVFFSMRLKADPIMIGIALNLFATDFSVWLMLITTGTKGMTGSLPSKVLPTVHIPFIEDIPILGQLISGHYLLTYVCVAIAIIIWIVVYKTPFGLRMKACGLDATAAESVGIKVNKVRLIALILSGFLAACGGAYLSMGYLSFYSDNMTAGRGWIGIAAAAVGGGNLGIVLLTTVGFAIAQAIVNMLILTSLPTDLVNTIPYICVLIGLVALSIREYHARRGKVK